MYIASRSEKFNELMSFLSSKEVLDDIERFYVKKNKSAGVRVRQYMAKAKRMEQQIRVEIQNIKKTLPKKRTKESYRIKNKS